MSTLVLVPPVVGQPSKTEDPKTDTAFAAIVTWANGNIDATNFGASLSGISSAWTNYVPTWTAVSVNPVIGNGVLVGRYIQIGKLVTVRISMKAGTTTTFGTGVWAFTLPVNPYGSPTADIQTIAGVANDGVSTVHPASGIVSGAATAFSCYSNGAGVTSAAPISWIAGATFLLQGSYESV